MEGHERKFQRHNISHQGLSVKHFPVQQVLKKLRRLPGGPQTEAYLVRCLLRSVKLRYAHAALAASLTAGLSKYRPSLGIALIDALLEEIRLGLEHPDTGWHTVLVF